jgi:trehalose 6-phosphate phosphatase
MLLLDYDGTLTPIVQRPGKARLTASVRQALNQLTHSVPVVIVSGRTLHDLRRRVGVPGIRYLAHHGLLYKEPGASGRWLGPRPTRRQVREWAGVLKSATEGITGALIEDKGVTVALHDRLVRPADRAGLRRRAVRALSPWRAGGQVMLMRGKRVLEVSLASSWNKGTAVARLLKEKWARGRAPVYFGDDRTDFDAFRVMRGRGLSVRVGGQRRVAGEDAWVPDPPKLEALLHWLAAQLERDERTVR